MPASPSSLISALSCAPAAATVADTAAGLPAALALYLPNIASALVGGIFESFIDLGELCRVLLFLVIGDYAMMSPHVAATGVLGHHQRVRTPAAAARQRPGQGHRDPRPTPPTRRAAASTRRT